MLEQVVVEEARRPGRGHDEGRVEDLDVAERACRLGDALLVAEDVLRVVRVVVDHRVPDGAGELQEGDVDRAVGGQLVGLRGARVVHVQDAHVAVVDEQCRVADRAVGRGDEGVDREAQRPGFERLKVLRLDEGREAELGQLLAQVVERVVRQQDGRVLVDVRGEVARVEVVVVEVRDVQVRRVADPLRVDPVVGRERVPRPEEGGVEPRVAQDADALGLDEQAGLAKEGDLHVESLAARSDPAPRPEPGWHGTQPDAA